mgnify:CR=1 FL=1
MRNEILAWVNSGAYLDEVPASWIDGVITPRQPGSTLKPLLYALALEKGWSAATLVDDYPLAEPVTWSQYYDMAEFFNGRDHSTVLHSYNKVAVLIEEEEQVLWLINDLRAAFDTCLADYRSAMDGFEVDLALQALRAYLDTCNGFAERCKPWELAKDESQAARLDAVLAHMVETVAHAAIQTGYRVVYREAHTFFEDLFEAAQLKRRKKVNKLFSETDLLIIDDLFLRKKIPEQAADDLLDIILNRYSSRKSSLITSNRPLEDWGKLLRDNAASSAIVDRLLHRGHLLQFEGRSYRLKEASIRLAANKRKRSG